MTINMNRVAEIADRSQTASDFMAYAASRQKEVREGLSDIRSLRTQMKGMGLYPVPQDLLVMFKELESIGIGKLQGHNFKWNTSIKKVGEIGLGGKEANLTKKPKPKRVIAPTPISKPVIPLALKTLVMYFDENKEVSVTFSSNLNLSDIELVMKKVLKECQS